MGDLLNVMDFEYLQLGGFLGIMSVKEFWKEKLRYGPFGTHTSYLFKKASLPNRHY